MPSNNNSIRGNTTQVAGTRVNRMPTGKCPGAWGGFSTDVKMNERYLSNWDRDAALRRFENKEFPLNPRAKSFTPALNPRAKAFVPVFHTKASKDETEEQLELHRPTARTGRPDIEAEKLPATGDSFKPQQFGITAWKSFAMSAEKTGYASEF
ncbi:hypothetical protein DFH27DRAFT_600171 [Peziza echinospora]|nr:hypothetical protein DFH27DRAFT_600171 [Peziza echinospora]